MCFNVCRMMCALLGGFFTLSSISAQAAAADDNWKARSSSLSDSGLSKPFVLNQRNREHHFLFSVAQNVKLKDAYFDFDATYLRQFACSDGLTVQINGIPTKVMSLSQDGAAESRKDGQASSTDGQSSMDIDFSIPLRDMDPAARFVDVGVSFNSKNNDMRCAEVAGHGNELRINPRSGIRYRYDANSVADVRSFLTTLPKNTQIMLPANVSSMQYEAALRLLLGLRNQGLNPEIVRLPKPGEDISVSALHLPDDLAGKPMFRHFATAMAQQRPLRGATDEDVAAWLALRLTAEQGFADIVIDSPDISDALIKAGKVWAGEGVLQLLPSWISQAVADKWQIKSQSTLANLSVKNWAGSQMLILDDADLTPAALMTSSFWSAVINGAELGVDHALPLSTESSGRLMIARDAPVRYLKDAVEWKLPFYAKDFQKDQLPNSLQLNLSAVKLNSASSAVVSVFVNDTLITAQGLNTDGEQTLISASIPFYSLKANNTVRVEVAGHGFVQSVPMQVLPSSYLGVTAASGEKEFFSLIPALSRDSTVVVPAVYLQHPEYTLSTVSRVLQGLQMTPASFKLQAVEGGKFSATGAFVSFDVAPEKLRNLVESHLDKLTISDKKGVVVFDSRGLGNLAVIQLIEGQGILVNRVGTGELDLEAPLALSSGNLAVVDGEGVKLVLNTNDPGQSLRLNEANSGLKYFLRRYHLWLLILGGLIGLALAAWATIHAWTKARQRAGRD